MDFDVWRDRQGGAVAVRIVRPRDEGDEGEIVDLARARAMREETDALRGGLNRLLVQGILPDEKAEQ